MSSLSAKDRVSLCQFTFSDGRRCRTPRTGKNPHFCFDHAQKEARARAVDHLGKDLDFFFSGGYLSACDLSTALGRLIPAVIRGDVKPRNARTVAYMAQILLQSIQISRHEYINAFDTDNWRNSIRNSVNGNYNHRFPHAAKPVPAPAPDQPISPQPQSHSAETFESCHSEPAAREESAFSSSSAPAPQPACPERTRRAPAPHTPLPPTSAEFAEQLLAGLKTGQSQAPQPAEAPAGSHSDVVAQAGIYPDRVGRPEEPASSSSTAPSPTTDKPQPPTQPAPPTAPPPQHTRPEQGQRVNPPPRPSTEPNQDTPWWDSRHLCDPPDSHLL